MNQQKFISSNIFVFSKWSRKAYAVFASLGKQIKIGVLKAEICQKALIKNFVDLGYGLKTKEGFDEDEIVPDTTIHDSLQAFLTLLGISVFLTHKLTTLSVSKKGNPSEIIFFKESEVCFLPGVKSRLFFMSKITTLTTNINYKNQII